MPSGSLNGDLKHYLIKVLLNNETVKTLNTSKTNYNVTGLEKFTIYGFIVSAENQIGVGPGSTETFNKTLADSKLINSNVFYSDPTLIRSEFLLFNLIYYLPKMRNLK